MRRSNRRFRSKEVCNYEGCSKVPAQELEMVIKGKSSKHYYCENHAWQAECNILIATVMAGTVANVSTKVREMSMKDGKP